MAETVAYFPEIVAFPISVPKRHHFMTKQRPVSTLNSSGSRASLQKDHSRCDAGAYTCDTTKQWFHSQSHGVMTYDGLWLRLSTAISGTEAKECLVHWAVTAGCVMTTGDAPK